MQDSTFENINIFIFRKRYLCAENLNSYNINMPVLNLSNLCYYRSLNLGLQTLNHEIVALLKALEK